MIGKRLCLSLDLPSGPLDEKSAGMLKNLTGGDLVSTDVKYQSRIRFYNSATFIFATNHAFLTKLEDKALFRRAIAIPFRWSVPLGAQDPYLVEKLQPERSGIIVKAMLAYRDLRQRGYRFTGNFPVNEVVEISSACIAVKSLEEVIHKFLVDHCTVDEDSCIFTEDVYQQIMAINPSFGSIDLKSFGTKLTAVVSPLYPPEQVAKVRTHKPGHVNAKSAYRGIKITNTL